MKHHKRRRWLLLFPAVALLLFALSPSAAALTPAYSVTGAYRSSTYHQNLLKIPRTGDEAFDTLAAAMTQVGYHEGNGTADFDGENASGSKNFTEYNRAFGKVGGSYGYAWCAAFISWCLTAADASDAAGGLFVSCSLWLEQLRANGQYRSRASGYTPQAGDLIFFCSSGAGRASDHVGLVRYVEGGRVYTVEGNSSNKVSLNSYAVTNTYIVGYGRPDYDSATLQAARSYEDRAVGFYAVTNSFVNLRTGANTASSKAGKLYEGDVVQILQIQNGWGMLERDGKRLYVSLDYADFISPSAHTVTYEADGGENAPATVRYFSTEAVRVSSQAPQRAGFRFLGWQGNDGERYTAGDTLPVTDLTLTALWELLPAEEPTPPAEEPTPPQTEDAPTVDDDEATTDGEQSDATDDLFEPPAPSPDAPIAERDEQDRNASASAADVATAIVLTAGAAGGTAWLLTRRRKRR